MHSTLVYAAFGSLSFFSALTSATPLRSLQSRAVAISGYDYVGCYSEATGQRALGDKVLYDQEMTIEICAAACAGYTWFGTEYGTEVWEFIFYLVIDN